MARTTYLAAARRFEEARRGFVEARVPLNPGPYDREPAGWTSVHVAALRELSQALRELMTRRREWDAMRREWKPPH